jgi:hypothetical protein
MKVAEHTRFASGTRRIIPVAALSLFLVAGNASAFAGAAPGIKVVGNQFVTTSAGTLGLKTVSANEAVVLRGINVSGTEYSCLGDGKDDGSATVWDSSNLPANTTDYQAVVNGMINNCMQMLSAYH